MNEQKKQSSQKRGYGLGPVTLSPILLSDGPDHLYTIQNENPEL